jgi:hypothetical protein
MLETVPEFGGIRKKYPVLTLPRLGSGVRFASPAPIFSKKIRYITASRRKAVFAFKGWDTAGAFPGVPRAPITMVFP